jgi:hypothetical protein
MMPEARRPATYRSSSRVGADPTTETEVIAELIRRTTAFRRVLLKLTLAAAILGGFGAFGLTAIMTERLPGRVAGALFAAGALLTFAAGHRLSHAIAAQREARWIAELAPRLGLEPQALNEAMGMFHN